MFALPPAGVPHPLRRRLHRNVPLCFAFAASALEAEDAALNLREEVQHLYEFAGLNGWNLVLVVGERRDALNRKGEPHTAEDTAEALKTIKWGRGREVTKPVAEKILAIYTKCKSWPKVCDLMQRSVALFGRDGPLEDYNKVASIMQAGKTENQTTFLIETQIEEQSISFPVPATF